MAILTWRNVPIPDIGTPLQSGLRNAGDMLSKAVGHATTGVTQLQAIQDAERAAQTEAADRFVLERMLAINDPAKLQQGIADGSLVGPAAGQVSSKMLTALDNRGTTLNARQDDAYTRERTRTQDAGEDRLTKLLQPAAPLAVNDLPGALKMIKESGASLEDQVKATQVLEQLNRTGMANAAAAKALQDEAFKKKVAENILKIEGVGYNPEKAGVILDSLDPEVSLAVRDGLKQRGYPVNTIAGAMPMFSDPGGNQLMYGYSQSLGRRFGNYTAKAMEIAGPEDPPPGTPEWQAKTGRTTPTMGDIFEWDRKHVLPMSEAQRGKGRGTTAIGPAQVVGSTREDFVKRHGKRLFGTDNMHEIPYTFENENKLAEAIYKEQMTQAIKSGKPENSPWEATNNYAGFRDLEVFKGRSWKEVAPLIYRIEGGVLPDNYANKVTQATKILEEEFRGLSEGAKVMASMKSKAGLGPAEAAQEVVSMLSSTSGKDNTPFLGDITQMIEEVARKSNGKLTHAEAAGLIMNSVRDDGIVSVSDLRKDLALDEGKLNKAIADAANMRTELESYERNAAQVQKLQELAQKYQMQEAMAESQLALAKRKADAGEAAIMAFQKLEGISNQMKALVARMPEDTVKKSKSEPKQTSPAPSPAPVSRANPPVGDDPFGRFLLRIGDTIFPRTKLNL